MAIIMDDPTTYLSRDSEDVAIMLAGSVDSAMFQAKQYGVSIQVNMAGGRGIRCVTNQAEAIAAVSAYPQATPWCMVNDGLWDRQAYNVLRSWFGPPKTVDKALGVETKGVAWHPSKFR